MKTYKRLYEKICSLSNLVLAWKKARKGKTKKDYVIEFSRNLGQNLIQLQKELINQTYSPKPLVNFILRDPKTRKISKSDFRDRIVYHAIVNVVEPIFDKEFIYDSCANRVGKGNLFAFKRFDEFKREVSNNFTKEAYVLKADIKHYFEEVDHKVLLGILQRKIRDDKTILLIKRILDNTPSRSGGRGRMENSQFCSDKNMGYLPKPNRSGMPLGNLTSQFFANVYLNELDYFIKHKIRIKYYIRYVDDFVILHGSKEQLGIWKEQIDKFLREKLKLELHSQKTKIISLSSGVDFVGFRNFLHHRLLRKRNIMNMQRKIEMFKLGLINEEKFVEIFQGWNDYASWANSYKLRKKIIFCLNLLFKLIDKKPFKEKT